MKRILTAILVLATVGGCASLKMEDSKAEAQKRWLHTRAGMLCGVAIEHLRSGQLDKAAAKAQEALALENDNYEATLLLGKIYIEQGEFPAAVAELKRAEDQQPTVPDAVYFLAVAQERGGQLPEALDNYRPRRPCRREISRPPRPPPR